MNVAVVGGGINGVMSAWALARKGCSVDLYERGQTLGCTSSASTKLLHGGLRYLEQGHIRLLRESVQERKWWMSSAPHLAKPLNIFLPVYKGNPRPRWMVQCGLTFYDWLAGQASLGRSHWCSRSDVISSCGDLRTQDLLGGFSFRDGQMDDCALGSWAAEKAAAAGVRMHTESCVESMCADASIRVDGEQRCYDRVVNATGPWARQLLAASGIAAPQELDPIRDSHLLLDHPCSAAFLFQSPRDARLCFVLPYHGKTLVGTAEVRQKLSEPICCGAEETGYLLELYRYYFPSNDAKICGVFSGLRSLVRSRIHPQQPVLDYAIEQTGRVVTLFGGKWTLARALGVRVADTVAVSC